MIPDPSNDQLAIDPKTGKLAVSLRVLPADAIKDIHAPTLAELNAAKPIGWVTGITRQDPDEE